MERKNWDYWEITYLEYDDEKEKEEEVREPVTIVLDTENNRCLVYSPIFLNQEFYDLNYFLEQYQTVDVAELNLICRCIPPFEQILKIEKVR